jgi:hypothetical protein
VTEAGRKKAAMAPLPPTNKRRMAIGNQPYRLPSRNDNGDCSHENVRQTGSWKINRLPETGTQENQWLGGIADQKTAI